MFIIGDLKFVFQLMGREGYSTKWCLWCNLSPSQWRSARGQRNEISTEQLWTVNKLKTHFLTISEGNLKEPSQVCGVKSYPIWDFVEVEDYIFPVLHAEIGLSNLALSGFLDFVDDRVEVISDEEKTARNNLVIADVAFGKATEAKQDFVGNDGINLAFFRSERVNVNKALRRNRITEHERNSLLEDRDSIGERIKGIMIEQERLQAVVNSARSSLSEANKALSEIRTKKGKIDQPLCAEIENMLKEFDISAAAYHGGQLNGVCCRRLMKKSENIFEVIERILLLSAAHLNKCSDADIKEACNLYRSIFGTLDTISSKL
jgi:hypothetical protein